MEKVASGGCHHLRRPSGLRQERRSRPCPMPRYPLARSDTRSRQIESESPCDTFDYDDRDRLMSKINARAASASSTTTKPGAVSPRSATMLMPPAAIYYAPKP